MADKKKKITGTNLKDTIYFSFLAGVVIGSLIAWAMWVTPLKSVLTSDCGIYVYHKGDTVYDAYEKYAECADKGKKTVLVIGSPDMEFLQDAASYFGYMYSNSGIGNELGLFGGGYHIAFVSLDEYTNAYEEALDSLTDMIVEFMPEGLSDAEKARYFHDYLCETGTSTVGNSGAYILLTDGVGECASYAEAYRILLTKVGIRNGIQQYSEHDGSDVGHVWNWYEIDGEIYYTDVFWDDNIYTAYIEKHPDFEYSVSEVELKYYNMSAEECAETHYISPYMPLECGK